MGWLFLCSRRVEEGAGNSTDKLRKQVATGQSSKSDRDDFGQRNELPRSFATFLSSQRNNSVNSCHFRKAPILHGLLKGKADTKIKRSMAAAPQQSYGVPGCGQRACCV